MKVITMPNHYLWYFVKFSFFKKTSAYSYLICIFSLDTEEASESEMGKPEEYTEIREQYVKTSHCFTSTNAFFKTLNSYLCILNLSQFSECTGTN